MDREIIVLGFCLVSPCIITILMLIVETIKDIIQHRELEKERRIIYSEKVEALFKDKNYKF